MIRLSTFDFYAPTSLTESLDVLAQGNGDTKILAGGTDLIVGLKQGVSQPKRVVWLGKLKELQQIAFSPEHGLRIGAMCTLDGIERNEYVQRYFPSLMQAARSIASPQIRNRATIGGNLCLDTRCFYYDQSEFWRGSLGFCLKHGEGICHAAPELDRCTAVFCSDLVPILVALDASVELCSKNGRRTIPLSQLYVNDGKRHLAIRQSEILAHIIVPYDPKVRSAQGKIRSRNSIDFPLVNVGVALTINPNNICEKARLVIGAVSSSPFDMQDAARLLMGKEITDDLINDSSDKASSVIRPLLNVHGSVSYRKNMVRVLVKKILREAIS